jgi:hypothetical protein
MTEVKPTANGEIGTLLSEAAGMYQTQIERNRRKINEALDKRPVPEWKQIAENIGIDITSSGGVTMWPSEKFVKKISPEQKKEMNELASFYGHFRSNPTAGMSAKEIETSHEKLNGLWKRMMGITFDDWELLKSAIVTHLREQEKPGDIARRELGIDDVYEAPKRDMRRQDMTREELIKAAENLLSIIKSD